MAERGKELASATMHFQMSADGHVHMTSVSSARGSLCLSSADLVMHNVQLGVHAVCVLTAESEQTSIGDWSLTQVQHLQTGQMLRQQP